MTPKLQTVPNSFKSSSIQENSIKGRVYDTLGVLSKTIKWKEELICRRESFKHVSETYLLHEVKYTSRGCCLERMTLFFPWTLFRSPCPLAIGKESDGRKRVITASLSSIRNQPHWAPRQHSLPLCTPVYSSLRGHHKEHVNSGLWWGQLLGPSSLCSWDKVLRQGRQLYAESQLTEKIVG